MQFDTPQKFDFWLQVTIFLDNIKLQVDMQFDIRLIRNSNELNLIHSEN